MDISLSEPHYSFSDIILSHTTSEAVQDVISMYTYREKVYDHWGLSKVIKTQKNICANFYGQSGVGKTITAQAVAEQLGKKILQVNYADIESKYVGETSKNLVTIFSEAEKNNAVLLFDEADALLSRRVTEMRSSTDVSVNQTRSVLLTLLDTFEGMVIFTTNFIDNYDSAFMRRIPYHIAFELPDEVQRKRLWEHYLVENLPHTADTDFLTEISAGCSGADISTATLNAAFRAARKGLDIIPNDFFKDAVTAIINSKLVNSGMKKLSVVTREVTEEYALSQINKKENEK